MSHLSSLAPFTRAARAAALVFLLGPVAAAEAQVSIGISRTADLDFGQAVAGLSAGTVTVTPGGARSVSGGATLGSGLAVSAASFTVTGQPSTAYGIVLPGSIALSSGSHSMTVDDFTSDPSGTGVLSGGGSQALSVGAKLHVSARQAGGSYSGTFSVTVAYN
jgi:hypothetical protein